MFDQDKTISMLTKKIGVLKERRIEKDTQIADLVMNVDKISTKLHYKKSRG